MHAHVCGYVHMCVLKRFVRVYASLLVVLCVYACHT